VSSKYYFKLYIYIYIFDSYITKSGRGHSLTILYICGPGGLQLRGLVHEFVPYLLSRIDIYLFIYLLFDFTYSEQMGQTN